MGLRNSNWSRIERLSIIVMANVLPIQYRNAFKSAYRARAITIAALIFTVCMGLGMVTLIPAYVAAVSQRNEAELNKDIQQQQWDASQKEASAQIAGDIARAISALERADKNTAEPAVTTILHIWALHAEDIIISSIEYDVVRDAKKKDEIHENIRISGIARNRRSLDSFVQEVRNGTTFTNVVFPVSDFASDADIEFSFVAEYAL